MEKFNFENMRIILVTSFSPILGYFTPTKGFVFSLVMMFSFNIWAGMRADGVSIVRCKNFSFRKFKNALCELILYLFIVETIFIIMKNCGDEKHQLSLLNRLLMFLCMCICKTPSATLLKHIPQRLRCVLFTTLSGWSLHGYCRDIGNR